MHRTDREFPTHLWCQLLEQIELQVNLIRPSRINQNRSAWEELHGNFDFNATPLAPLGTKGVIYVSPKARDTTYSDHGKEGWYIGPVFNKYRNYRLYIESTRGIRESNAVEFFPTKLRIPNNTAKDRMIAAIDDLAHELKQLNDMDNSTTMNEHGTPVNRAIKSLQLNMTPALDEASEILKGFDNNNQSPRVIDSDTNQLPRVIGSDASPPRVINNNAKPSRVKANASPSGNKSHSWNPSVNEARSRYGVGTKISKRFDGISYEGQVIKPFDGRYYKIEYEDGDEE